MVKSFILKCFRLNSVSLATDPPIKPQLSNSSVPPGTGNLNKSPQAGKNSYTLNIFNNNIYTNFKTAYTHVNSAMVLCSIIIWVTNSSDYRRVWTANLLHTKQLPNPVGHKARRIQSTRMQEIAVETFLRSLEVVIQIILKRDTIAV